MNWTEENNLIAILLLLINIQVHLDDYFFINYLPCITLKRNYTPHNHWNRPRNRMWIHLGCEKTQTSSFNAMQALRQQWVSSFLDTSYRNTRWTCRQPTLKTLVCREIRWHSETIEGFYVRLNTGYGGYGSPLTVRGTWELLCLVPCWCMFSEKLFERYKVTCPVYVCMKYRNLNKCNIKLKNEEHKNAFSSL